MPETNAVERVPRVDPGQLVVADKKCDLPTTKTQVLVTTLRKLLRQHQKGRCISHGKILLSSEAKEAIGWY